MRPGDARHEIREIASWRAVLAQQQVKAAFGLEMKRRLHRCPRGRDPVAEAFQRFD